MRFLFAMLLVGCTCNVPHGRPATAYERVTWTHVLREWRSYEPVPTTARARFDELRFVTATSEQADELCERDNVDGCYMLCEPTIVYSSCRNLVHELVHVAEIAGGKDPYDQSETEAHWSMTDRVVCE